jgi:hypothetical protein
MPFQLYNKKWVVRCVNDPHGKSLQEQLAAMAQDASLVETTMEVMPDWGLVPMVNGPGPDPNSALRHVSNYPVRIFRCRICGYTEMYSGPLVAPEVWRRHG